MIAIIGGGNVVDCARSLKARIEELMTEASQGEFTAPRVPIEQDTDPLVPVVTVPAVLSGGVDLNDRETPALPFVAVRIVQTKSDTLANQPIRAAPIKVVIGTHCPVPADYEYAWLLSELITRNLAARPYLSDGAYQIDAEGIETTENTQLAEHWQNCILEMTVPVFLPAFTQTEDMHGDPLRYEDTYPE